MHTQSFHLHKIVVAGVAVESDAFGSRRASIKRIMAILDHRFATLGQPLIVFGQTTVAIEPPKGSLRSPLRRQA